MSDGRPTLVVLGGINGAGKSTLERHLSGRPEFRGILSLNADVETARLIASQRGLSATAAQFLGLRIVAEALQANIVARQSVITETVFASEAIIRLMRQASDLGFKVIVYFVALPDVETAIRRVALRVAKGGHNVPEADIRRRWPRAHENLGRAVTVADEVSVFANEGRGRPIRLVARALQGSIVLLKSDAPPAVTAVLGPLIG